MVYEPAEDSMLLKRNIPGHAKGKVLDMGTGSGILAEEAKKYADKVYAADIDQGAIEYCKKNIPCVEFIESDLFSNISGRFDTIIFNPPYLPADKGIEEPALYGGKRGYEVIARFFGQVLSHMKKDTKILLLFSSKTKKEKVEEIIQGRCLSFKEIDRENVFFERLFVYLIEKSPLLKELEEKNIENVEFFARGKRGIVYKGILDGENVIIKTKNPDSEAIGRIDHEAWMLERLNKYGIGPHYLFSGRGYLVYGFVQGEMFPEYIKDADRESIADVLDKVFAQLQKLDELGINKEEMHRPNKHIIIGESVVLIDFERARFTEKPHNITQFVKYLTSGNIYPVLSEKGFCFDKNGLLELAKNYRKGKVSAEKIKEYVKT